MRPSEPFTLQVLGEDPPRKISGEIFGPESASHVIIALPGLLETQRSFNGLIRELGDRFRIFTFDWAGRGDSSPMTHANDYRMSSYFRDLGLIYAFIQGRLGATRSGKSGLSLFREKSAGSPSLHLLGTSMGGLLALFLAATRPPEVKSLVLNDVGCLLPWTGIVGLMSGIHGAAKAGGIFSNLRDLAQELNIDHRLIRAVQQPGHLDLPHETTLSGVDFSKTFAEVHLPLLILKGEKSEIVNSAVAKRLMDCNPETTIVEIEGADHPVPYNARSCRAIAEFIAPAVEPVREQ